MDPLREAIWPAASGVESEPGKARYYAPQSQSECQSQEKKIGTCARCARALQCLAIPCLIFCGSGMDILLLILPAASLME